MQLNTYWEPTICYAWFEVLGIGQGENFSALIKFTYEERDTGQNKWIKYNYVEGDKYYGKNQNMKVEWNATA